MKIVNQRRDYDCVIACLCMLTGMHYESFDTTLIDAIEKAKGCSGDLLDEAFDVAGFTKDVDTRTLYAGNNYNLIKSVIWGRKALIQVPSLNYERGEHMIYWDGEKLYDPSRKQKYKYMNSVFPTLVIIFDGV